MVFAVGMEATGACWTMGERSEARGAREVLDVRLGELLSETLLSALHDPSLLLPT